jgi:hypothetical protein
MKYSDLKVKSCWEGKFVNSNNAILLKAAHVFDLYSKSCS